MADIPHDRPPTLAWTGPKNILNMFSKWLLPISGNGSEIFLLVLYCSML